MAGDAASDLHHCHSGANMDSVAFLEVNLAAIAMIGCS